MNRSVASLLLAAIALGVAAPALDGPFLLDDAVKIVHNTDIRRLDELPAKLVYPYQQNQVLERNDPSRPVVYLVYALLYRVAGPNPIAYHLASALLHALGGILLFLIAARILELTTGERRAGGPFLAALFYLVLPIQVGTVVYAYGLSDVLSATLVLLSIHLYVRREAPRPLDLALSALVMAVAVFTKQSAAILPLYLLLFDLVFRCDLDFRRLAARWRGVAPHLAIAALWVAFRLSYFGEVGDLEGKGNTHPTLPYLFAQPLMVLRYLRLTAFPYGLALDHHVVPSTDPDWLKVLAFVLLGAAIVLLGFLARRRTPRAKLALFAAAFYLCALAPTSSFLPTVDLLVERRAYLANAGLVLLALLLYRPGGLRWRGRHAVLALAALYAVVLAGLSVRRALLHRSAEAVWEHVLESYPESPRALNSLANLAMERKDFAHAKRIYELLAARDPTDYIALGNLGSVHEKEESPYHDPEKAIRFFQRALGANRDYAAAYYNLGRLHQKRGEAALAEAYYKKALALNPSYVLAHNNLGLLYFHQGRREEARRRYERALELDPTCAPARQNLALLDSGASPSAARPAVPTSQVPSSLLVKVYRSALARQPENLAIRRKFAELCVERRLPCARPEVEALLARDPADEVGVRLRARLGEGR